MKNRKLLVPMHCRLFMAAVMVLGLFTGQVLAKEKTSLRVIYYSHQDLDKALLLEKLNSQVAHSDKIEYLRKMRSSGHVLRLISKDEQSLNQLMQTIKHLPLTRLLEADSIIKIQ